MRTWEDLELAEAQLAQCQRDLATCVAERDALVQQLAETKARAPSSRTVCLGETGDYDVECTACGRSLDEGEHSVDECVRYAKESAAADALMCHDFALTERVAELDRRLVEAKELCDELRAYARVEWDWKHGERWDKEYRSAFGEDT